MFHLLLKHTRTFLMLIRGLPLSTARSLQLSLMYLCSSVSSTVYIYLSVTVPPRRRSKIIHPCSYFFTVVVLSQKYFLYFQLIQIRDLQPQSNVRLSASCLHRHAHAQCVCEWSCDTCCQAC